MKVLKKVSVTIKGCIDIPAELWDDPEAGEDFPLEVAEFRYNEQLTEKDAIQELAEMLMEHPEDLEVRIERIDKEEKEDPCTPEYLT